jgi:choline dehydrogenase-like flavoprotein
VERLRADAVVVGSGAGGAPAACALAEAGLDVVVLEAGPRLETSDFTGEPQDMLARLMTAANAAGSGMELYAGRCVGGSTVVNDALCWRPPPEILDAWARALGAELSQAAFAPYVERVWETIGAAPTDRAHLNRNAWQLERGAARLGWRAGPMARNVRGCANLGLCNLGCPTGAKQSALLTWIPRAERAGARVLPGVRVERVRVEAGGAVGVDAVRVDPIGAAPETPLAVDAPLVVLAAGVLATPAILLRSGVAAGGGVQLHSSVHVTARFPEPVHGYYGPTMAYAVSQFSDVNGHGGPGFMLENVTVDAVTTAGALPGFGDAHARRMAALPYLARALVVLRDRARGTTVLGRDGAARIEYEPFVDDLWRLREGMAAIARAYLAAGALEVWLPLHDAPPILRESDLAGLADWEVSPRSLTLLYAVHLFGGAVMAPDAQSGPCDPSGAVRGVRGLYVSDASGLPGNTGVNPQVTVQANALRVADAALASRGAGTLARGSGVS